MVDVLFLYLEHDYKTGTDTGTFDNTLFTDMVDADIGVPLTSSGQPLLHAYGSAIDEALDHEFNGAYPQISSVFHEAFCVTSDEAIADEARLFDGSTVSLSEYDVLVVSHLWAYNYYIRYLTNEYPDTPIVGIMEGGFQDAAFYSPQLQLYHRDVLRSLDGYIYSTEQYGNYIDAFVDRTLYLPLHVPHKQFADVPIPEKRSGAICLGVTTWNIDHSNFYTNVLVLDSLRDEGHDVRGEIVGVQEHHRPMVRAYNELDHVSTVEFLDDEFYEYLASFRFAVHLTARATSGRVSAEFAGVGVPVIGNRHNDLQRRCWPELSVDPYDFERAKELAERLAVDDAFYEQTVDHALSALSDLQDHERTAAKLRSYFESLCKRR